MAVPVVHLAFATLLANAQSTEGSFGTMRLSPSKPSCRATAHFGSFFLSVSMRCRSESVTYLIVTESPGFSPLSTSINSLFL